MPVERRGWVIAFEIGSTGNGRNPIFNGRRQPSCGGTSRMTRECQVRIWCSEASCHSSGGESRQQRSPVAVVVISSNGEGNRSVGSLEVKAPGGRACRSDPYRGASNLAGRSKCVNREAPKYLPRLERRTQTTISRCMPGAGLSRPMCGKVLPYMPALQPYRGKPAVRNDREGRGNVGIIRSPVRASTLPD